MRKGMPNLVNTSPSKDPVHREEERYAVRVSLLVFKNHGDSVLLPDMIDV